MNIGIVGGGLSGLASAFSLMQAGHHVVVYEQGERPGGVVCSKHRDGFVLEQGAGSVRGASRDVYQLFIDAGVADQVVPASKESNARYLLHEGTLRALPNGPKELFRIPGLGRRGTLRLMQEPFRPAGHTAGEETVYDFFARRIGAKAARALGDPMMAGIFGGDPTRIEVGSAFPTWVKWEQDHGSMVRGAMRNRTSPPHGLPKGTFSLRGGIGTLIDALVAHLGDAIRLEAPVESIEPERSRVTVHAGGRSEVHDQLLITAPQAALRGVLPGLPSGWLDDIPAAPLAPIHLAYDGPAIPDGLPGFGWLVHSGQRADVLGCLWVSGTFPSHAPAGKHLVRLMVGGARDPELASRPDEVLIEHARKLIRDVQGVTAEPLFAEVNRAVIPQYPVGFARRLRLLDQVHPRVRFGGWWWGQLGVAASAELGARLVRDWRNR